MFCAACGAVASPFAKTCVQTLVLEPERNGRSLHSFFPMTPQETEIA